MKTVTRRTRPLGVRLLLVIAVMLLPHVIAGGVGMFNSRTTARALNEFRTETADASIRIKKVSDLLVPAEHVGEAYVETGDRAQGELFADLSGQIDDGFADLTTLGTPEERTLAAAAHARWEAAFASVEKAALAPLSHRYALLDFHNGLDEARALLADVDKSNVQQAAVELDAMRARDQWQIFASLGTFRRSDHLWMAFLSDL